MKRYLPFVILLLSIMPLSSFAVEPQISSICPPYVLLGQESAATPSVTLMVSGKDIVSSTKFYYREAGSGFEWIESVLSGPLNKFGFEEGDVSIGIQVKALTPARYELKAVNSDGSESAVAYFESMVPACVEPFVDSIDPMQIDPSLFVSENFRSVPKMTVQGSSFFKESVAEIKGDDGQVYYYNKGGEYLCSSSKIKMSANPVQEPKAKRFTLEIKNPVCESTNVFFEGQIRAMLPDPPFIAFMQPETVFMGVNTKVAVQVGNFDNVNLKTAKVESGSSCVSISNVSVSMPSTIKMNVLSDVKCKLGEKFFTIKVDGYEMKGNLNVLFKSGKR